MAFRLLVVLILLVVVSGAARRHGRHLRGLGAARSDSCYNSSALDFLLEYGEHYRLFDQFFSTNSSQIKQNITLAAVHGITTKKVNIAKQYKTLDYGTFKSWELVTAKVKTEYKSLEFEYKPKAINQEIMEYNNRFRWGPQIDDRFMTITFDRDPWTESTSTALAYVYFVGVNTDLVDGVDYICSFNAPLSVTSPVEITRHIPDVLSRPTQNSIIRCAVPWALVKSIGNRDPDTVVVTLDLVKVPRDNKEANFLLEDIHIPRMHALHRRQYKHVAHTMVEVLDDVMVVEWLVYNIMLGMEHFYVYYNAKATDLLIETSLLKPFLDANIITLVYFPYLHTVHFMAVQHAALNAFLRSYGRYTEWVGFWDVDEFFMPAKTFLPYKQHVPQVYNKPVLPILTRRLAGGTEPGIMFDTLDMDCAEGSENFYQGGDNLKMPAETKSLVGSPAAQSGNNVTSLTISREAVSTHCLRTGFYFHELSHGHGKMLLRTSQISYVMSPHRLNHYYIVWTDGNSGGLIRHFNRFRNTAGYISTGAFSKAQIGSDDTLETFTFTSLRDILGIYL